MASESEQERRETLADIVAEMRTRSREVKEAFGGRPDGVENMLDIWAGRIEAMYTPGNAAAMREALVWMRNRMVAAVYDGSFDCDEALRKIEAALSAPARQCDVGTAEEQSGRMEKSVCSKHHGCVRCPLRKAKYSDCSLGWAQTPYEAKEGAGK